MEFADNKTFKHCQATMCKQLDFLPFFCKECGLTFCRDHQQWRNHNCTAGLKKLQGRIARNCEHCDEVVSQISGKSFEESLKIHRESSACTKSTKSSKKRRKKKKHICSAKGCTESVRASYMHFYCKSCHKKYCVKHRSVDLHNCKIQRENHLDRVKGAKLASDGGYASMNRCVTSKIRLSRQQSPPSIAVK